MQQPPCLRLNLLVLAMLASTTAHAQDPARPAPTASAPTLQEVTVRSARAEAEGTAEDGYVSKKVTGVGLWGERDVQDTPYSITVVPQELIENANARDMDQIFKMNPNTQETAKIASDATDAPWVTIRGLSVNNPIVNGIPYATRTAGVPSMQAIERVEIINGATGFLYGGGRVGGAVNYITKKPTLENLRNVAIGYRGGSAFFGHLDLGGQIDRNHVFGYRFNAAYEDGRTTRKELRRTKAASLVLDFKPTDTFYADLSFSHKDTVAPGPNIFWSGSDNIIDRDSIRRNRTYTPDWLQQDFRSNKIENSIRWTLSDVFTLRTGLLYEKVGKTGGDARMYFRDGMVGAESWFGNYAFRKEANLGGAIFLDSRFKTGPVVHTLTVGYSATSDKTRNTSRTSQSFRVPTNITLDDFHNYPQPAAWGQVGRGEPLLPGSKTAYSNILIGDDIKFNDQWSALIGVNYATTESKNYRSNSGYRESALTPTLSLMYKPVRNLTTYATYIESLEAGSIVGTGYQNEGEVLKPLKSKQFEIGAKYALSERAMLNMAVFRIEKPNSFDVNTRPLPTRTQDGKQVHQGLEVGFMGKVTDDLTLIAGGTVMDLKVAKASDPTLSGKKPTGAASRMAKITAEYRIPAMPGLTLSAGAYHTGKRYYDSANTQTVPDYTLFDAGLRYATKLAGNPTTFNFTVQNITDKVYWSGSAALGNPRTFALTVRSAF